MPPTPIVHRACWATVLVVALGCNRQPVAVPETATESSAELSVDLAGSLLFTKTARSRPEVVPRFISVAKSSGIDFTFFSDIVPDRYFLPEIMGGGAAWFDFDLDGWLDLYLMNGCPLDNSKRDEAEKTAGPFRNRLFRSHGAGRFSDVSRLASAFQDAAAGNRYGQGVAVGDYDADGFPDLYLANYGPNVLLRNNGDGTFSDVTHVANVADELWGTSPIWLDLNGDGYLDLYVVNYLLVTRENSTVCKYDGVIGYCGPGSYEAAPHRAFISGGDGTFVEAAKEYGLLAPGGKGLASAALDFDNDLKAEIYVANDMMPNFLFTQSSTYRADADSGSPSARYANVAMEAGCAVSGSGENEASMGVACGDFDGDQLVDIFLTHYYAHKNTLYHNLGNLLFHDDSYRTRIAATSYETLGFGTVAFDYDRDSAIDLFVANGHVLGPKHSPDAMPPQLLSNDGQGRFVDISEFSGPYFQQLWLGRGAAGGDYDNDGDLDLLVTHIGQPVALLRNDTQTKRHWIGVDLHTRERLTPVGGRVVVAAGTHRITLPVVAGGSYLCSSDPRLLFGLGDHAERVLVEVHWPSGRVDVYSDVQVDRYWRITEGQTPE